jgi:hypothetical protein
MFIPDPNFFHPGFGSASKNLSVLLQKKMVSKLSEIWSGLFIPDPDPGTRPDFLPIADPGVKKAPDPGSESATLLTILVGWLKDPDPFRNRQIRIREVQKLKTQKHVGQKLWFNKG